MQEERDRSLHACPARGVDDDRLACVVHIVLHAKVGRHPVDQHAVVRRHGSELLKGAATEAGQKRCKEVGMTIMEIKNDQTERFKSFSNTPTLP